MSTKRKHSAMWTHFSEEIVKKKAKCNHCSQSISIAGGSHGNLSRHLKVKHPLSSFSVTRQPLPSCESNQSPLESPPSTSTSTRSQPATVQQARRPQATRKVETINRQVIKMIAKGYHALRIVEEPEFRSLIEMVSHCPGYQLPTRQMVTKKLLPQSYTDLLPEVKDKVRAAPALCLTVDAWTSRNKKSYLAITANFLDSSTRLCSALISCEEYNNKQTGDSLCNFLKGVMSEWQISNKIVAVVSDNTANITAIRLGEWRSVECFARVLNVLVQKATKEIADTVLKIKSIVEYFNRSTHGLKKLRETQKQMNIPEVKLKQDVPSRWNSTYDMLERVVKIKDAVTVGLLGSDVALDPQDWVIIEEVLAILKPFYEVTKEISAEKNVTLSKVMVFGNLLQQFLAKCFPKNDKVTALLSVLKSEMEIKFRDLEEDLLYAECTILDPRFKQKGFKNQRTYQDALMSLQNRIASSRLRDDIEIKYNTAPGAVDFQREASSLWDGYDQEIKKITRPDSKVAAGIIELNQYLNEEYLDRKKDPLQWWEGRRSVYPYLYAFILKRFCIVATAIPCERIFSAAGQIMNERRTLLKSENVSNLIFLHDNM